jgi:hypothetical protein
MSSNGPDRRPDQAGHPDQDRDRVADRVARCAAGGQPAIDRRLAELDREWEAGRFLAVAAGAAVLAGTTLGVVLDRRLLAIPAIAGGLLLLSGRTGWGTRALRPRGYRTGAEIGEERAALKALRGDFRHLPRLTPAADRAAVTQWEGEGGSSAPEGEGAHDEHDRAAAEHALGAARS